MWRWGELLYSPLCPTNEQMKPHLWSLWSEHRRWPASLVTAPMEKPGGLAIGRRLPELLKRTVGRKGSAELGGEGSAFSAMGTEQNTSRSLSEGGRGERRNPTEKQSSASRGCCRQVRCLLWNWFCETKGFCDIRKWTARCSWEHWGNVRGPQPFAAGPGRAALLGCAEVKPECFGKPVGYSSVVYAAYVILTED